MKNFYSMGSFTFLLTVWSLLNFENLSAVQGKDDWPKFRGQTQDAIAEAKGLFDSMEDIGLKIAWKKKLGSGYSSVSVVDGLAVTMFSDSTYDYAIALDAEAGKEKWRYRIDSTYIGHLGSHNGPISTPALDDNQVFCLGPKGQLFALDLKSGKLNWKIDMVENADAFEPFYGFATNPHVNGDVLIVQTGNGADNMIAGFNKHSGKPLWTAGSDTVRYHTPITTNLNGENQLIAVGETMLYGLHPETGEKYWEFKHDGFWECNIPILVGEDKIYMNHANSETMLIQINKSDETYSVQEIWRTRDLSVSYSPAVYFDDYLYGYRVRFLSCVDVATGKTVWKSRPPGDGFPIVVEGHLVVITKKGSLHIIEATPEKYNEVASLQVLNGLTWTPASFADGKIYVRNLYEIAAVEVVRSEQTVADVSDADTPVHSEFLRFIANLENNSHKTTAIDSFMTAQKAFPVIEGDTLVHVVYRGDVGDIAIAGDMLGARGQEDMSRVAGTDFYYYSFVLEPDARIHYHFIKDYEERMLDPLNPDSVQTFMRGDFSLLAMPKWVSPPHLEVSTDIARGKLDTVQFESKVLQNARTVEIYTPPGYENSTDPYSVIYFNNAEYAVERGKLPNTFDNLVAAGMKPFMAVLIHRNPESRLREYVGDLKDRYAKMLVDELVPYIDRAYRTRATSENRFITGGGPGGYISVYASFYRPGMFGKVAGQSTFLMYTEVIELEALIRKTESFPLEFYFEWGKYDFRTDDNNINFPARNLDLVQLLQKKGFKVTHRQVNESWGWSSWRNRTDKILEGFFFNGSI